MLSFEEWKHFFSYVNLNKAVEMINAGKISPWLILGCGAGKKMLQSFTDEQLQMIEKNINPEYWSSKFKNYPADFLFVQETAKGAKIE